VSVTVEVRPRACGLRLLERVTPSVVEIPLRVQIVETRYEPLGELAIVPLDLVCSNDAVQGAEIVVAVPLILEALARSFRT